MSQDASKCFSDAGYRHYEGPRRLGDDQRPQGRLGSTTSRTPRPAPRDLGCYTRPSRGCPRCVRPPGGDTIHARHLYTTLVDDRLGKSRDRVLDELIAPGSARASTIPASLLPRAVGLSGRRFPSAEHIGDRTLSPPLSPTLINADVGDVIAAVRAVRDLARGMDQGEVVEGVVAQGIPALHGGFDAAGGAPSGRSMGVLVHHLADMIPADGRAASLRGEAVPADHLLQFPYHLHTS